MTDQTLPPSGPAPNRQQRGRTAAIVGTAILAGCAAVLYGLGSGGKEVPAQCHVAEARQGEIRKLLNGAAAGFTPAKPTRLEPDFHFKDHQGNAKTLADYRGRTILVNLWATWCLPCRAEMPALNTLQKQVGGTDFEVVAINVDQAGLERARTYLGAIGAEALALYTDPEAKTFATLRSSGQALGLPTTLLIDRQGCEVGSTAGAVEWSAPEAIGLIDAVRKS